MGKLNRTCPVCKISFHRYPSQATGKIVCCSKTCYHKNMSKTMLGKNNPNFNKKWSVEQKEQQSQLIKSKITDELRFLAGSANRGKKFSQKRIEKCHGHRTKESYSRSHTKESKRLIGQKSKAKWTKEYHKKHRQKMEDRGYWIPLKDKKDIEIYYKEANWIERMFDLIQCKKQIQLLKDEGVFHNTKNTKGVVRDHMLSRRTGFNLGIFPQILRHPCNCQLLLASDNIKKKSSQYVDADAISVDELFTKIINYTGSWQEQKLCEKLIQDYKNGKRYERNK